MGKINFEDTTLDGLKIITPFYEEDRRGYFLKAFEKDLFIEAGVNTDISETFESYSVKGVVRGLHFQKGENAQAKLVRVLAGEVYDVCVDIRPSSPTFGMSFGVYLSGDNHKALYIDKGFAHGFVVTGDYALMSYTVSGKHNTDGESGIYYGDKDLNINWPTDGLNIIQSERDSKLQSFKEYCDSL